MKISIIHFSDLHIKSKNDKLLQRIDLIIEAINTCIYDAKHVFIIYNGDMTDRGEDFSPVTSFVKQIESKIKEYDNYRIVKNICVPGNHDCNFNNEIDVREILVNSIIGKDEIKEQVINSLLSVQDQYWDFYREVNGEVPANKMNYFVKIPISVEYDISFNCFNSSWMSMPREKHGDLIFPQNSLLPFKPIKKTIAISVFHHPISWFSPNTENNNSKLFQRHILQNSNLVFTGHEHHFSASKSKDVFSDLSAYFLEGYSLNEKNKNSGFNVIDLETDTLELTLNKFEYIDKIYSNISTASFPIPNLKKSGFQFSKKYLEEISKIPIPISHSNKENLSKWDLYIYPDLDPILDKDSGQYIEACDILIQDNNNIIIEGEPQSGKTSLLQKLQIDLHDINKVAIYINAREIKGIDIESYIKRAIKHQFEKVENSYELFLKTPLSDRILLIDDIEKSLLNKENKKKLFDRTATIFSKSIIISSNENEINSILKSESFFKDFLHYKILPFGRVKRNELIETWIKLGKDFTAQDELEFTHTVQANFNKLSELLGEQLIPPYPVFLLTLMQSLSSTLNFNIEQTSYAYCYQSLITLGLVKSGVSKDNLGSIINFLSHLAYHIHKKPNKKINYNQFVEFYEAYRRKFIIKYNADKLLEILLDSNIMNEENDELKFPYKYLFYYLTAKKMATDFDNDVINEIKILCSSLDVESNANIIIFLVHHTGHSELIEELLFNSMLPFEKNIPITLNSEDTLFKFLNEFISEITPEVIPKISNHIDERKKRLKKEDERDRINNNVKKSNGIVNDEDDDELNEELKELIRANKIIKILGQIVKNQHGVFEKDQLVDLVNESYQVCFRSISHVADIISVAKPKLINQISEEIENGDKSEIISKINRIIHNLGYRFCLQSFSNLGSSVGASNMDEIYEDVAKKIGTPAAKLMSFSIKSYYGKLNVSDLEELINDFKKNPVATDILRARVKSYLYQHPVDYKKEQKISELCKFSLDTSAKIIYKEKNNLK